jgi:hypothetical protein
MNLKILNILLCVLLSNILGNCTLSSGSQNGDDILGNETLTFGPGTLEELKSDPDFIAAYGSIPSLGSSEERKQWLDKLDKVYAGVNADMSKYMYPDGPVTRYGYSVHGVFEVAVNKTVEKLFMDEIYNIFDSKGSQMGIKEVPVVFVHGDLAVPVAGGVTSVVKEAANLSISGEKSTGELNNSKNSDSEPDNENSSKVNSSGGNKSSENKSAPGFELLVGLTCLYGGWKLRKK